MKIHGTAKGGAESKKNFGVAFGGAAVVEAIAKDTQVQVQNSTESIGSGTLTKDITIADNNNRILIVTVTSYNPAPAATGVTFGSQNLTQGGLTLTKGDGNGRASIWYLVAPTVGTDTITVTWNETIEKRALLAYSFYNVDQDDPIGVNVVSASTGQTNTITETITPTTDGSMILDCISWILGGSNNAHPVVSLTAGGYNIYTGGKTGASQYDLDPTIDSANTMGWTSLDDNGSTSEAAWWRSVRIEVLNG